MWILRFLTGPTAGQTVALKKASTLIGRGPNCDVRIPSPSISKEHTRIELFEDKVIVSDAGSRNGTYLNGVQIRTAKAVSGDRIAIHDIIAEIHLVPENWAPMPQMPRNFHPQVSGNTAINYQYESQMEPPPPAPRTSKLPEVIARSQEFLDKEILPGVLKLPEMFDFAYVLGGFMLLFIVLVTSLSTIPLIRILKVSIEEESQRHALTIATTLASANKPAIIAGTDSAVSVDIATSRPGVKKALVISNLDGNIIAPATLAGTYPQLDYVHEGRKLGKESVKQIDDDTIIAMVPISIYSPEKGEVSVSAYAVVYFDMSAMAVDNSQIISLFITTLFIALVVGSILFFFLYKVVEHPFRSLNNQLDVALKEGRDTVSVTYRFPALQTLSDNISSTLTRALNGSENASGKAIEHDRNREISNLVQLMGFATVGVHAHDLTIAAVNPAFESRTGISAEKAAHMTVNEISDQALKLSIKDLIERLDQNPDELASNELEFSGEDFNIVAQAVFGTAKIAYYLIVLLPVEEGE